MNHTENVIPVRICLTQTLLDAVDAYAQEGGHIRGRSAIVRAALKEYLEIQEIRQEGLNGRGRTAKTV